jgi:hypothetical protein
MAENVPLTITYPDPYLNALEAQDAQDTRAAAQASTRLAGPTVQGPRGEAVGPASSGVEAAGEMIGSAAGKVGDVLAAPGKAISDYLITPAAYGVAQGAAGVLRTGEYLARSAASMAGFEEPELIAGKYLQEKMAENAPDMNLVQGLISGTAQFLTGLKAASVGAKLLGVGGRGAKMLGKAPKVVQQGVQGMAGSQIAFDPYEPKIAALGLDYVMDLADFDPATRKALTDYMTPGPETPEAEARLQTALSDFLTGSVVGQAFSGLARAGKPVAAWLKDVVKAAKQAREMPAPRPKGFTGPANPDAQRAAREYMAERGIPVSDRPYPPERTIAQAKATGLEYEKMAHDPANPNVRAAYDAFKRETWAMYQGLVEDGWTFNFTAQDAPPNSAAVLEKAKQKIVDVFTGVDMPGDHPLMELAPNGQVFNTIFRAVHEVYGHIANGNGFGPRGEDIAWWSHGQMYSPHAIGAMSTETIGQNSWVNFGPHRFDETGALVQQPARDLPFAEQKAGLLPQHGQRTAGPPAGPTQPQPGVAQAAARGMGALPGQGSALPINEGLLGEMTQRLQKPGGGFTASLQGFEEPTSGYAVARPGSLESPLAEFSPEGLLNFVTKNLEALQQGGKLGGWHDPETGRVYVEISDVLPTLREALTAAQPEGKPAQKAIYDFAAGQSIPVEGTVARDYFDQARQVISDLKRTFTEEGERGAIDPTVMKDLAVAGAAFAMRGAKYARGWQQALVDEFGEPVRPLLGEKLDNAVQARIAAYAKAGWDQAKATRTMLKAYHEGTAGRGWYDQTLTELQNIYGPEDGRLMAAFLAVTSPNTTLKSNVTLALKAFEIYKAKGEITPESIAAHLPTVENVEHQKGFLGSVVRNLNLVAKGQEPAAKGGSLKVLRFYQALMGDPNAVVLDRWMIRAMWPEKIRQLANQEGLQYEKYALTESQYKMMERVVQQKARELGVTPRDLQAMIWVGMKRIEEGGETEIRRFEDILKERRAQAARQPSLFDTETLPDWVTEE